MSVKDILHAHGFRFKKKYGQNFITDSALLARIADQAHLCATDTVLEIGPGAGTLTRALSERAGTVVAVEIDEQLKGVLADSLHDCSNVHLVFGDALAMDLQPLAQAHGGDTSFKIVANLPYYITTPLIMHVLEDTAGVTDLVIMVQQEVADRLVAAPGSKAYGAITVMVQYYADIAQAFRVPRTVFYPVPDVDSAILHIRPRPPQDLAAVDTALLRRLVRAAFGQRRKTLRNALGTAAIDKTVLTHALAHCGIDGSVRGETLAVADFVCLANACADPEVQHADQ